MKEELQEVGQADFQAWRENPSTATEASHWFFTSGSSSEGNLRYWVAKLEEPKKAELIRFGMQERMRNALTSRRAREKRDTRLAVMTTAEILAEAIDSLGQPRKRGAQTEGLRQQNVLLAQANMEMAAQLAAMQAQMAELMAAMAAKPTATEAPTATHGQYSPPCTAPERSIRPFFCGAMAGWWPNRRVLAANTRASLWGAGKHTASALQCVSWRAK